jgi:hypothetical protein
LQAAGRRIVPDRLHQGRLAQLVRAVVLRTSGREFESLAAHHNQGVGQGMSRWFWEPEHVGSIPTALTIS